MRKRKTKVKTPDDIQAAIKRHQSRIKRSVNAIDKLQRQLKRSLNAEYAKTNAALTAAIKEDGAPIAEAKSEVKTMTDLDTRGTDAPPVVQPKQNVEDIPTFLLRKPLSAESQQVAAEVAEKKKIKAKAQSAKRKAIKAERDQSNSIPASKRRWDTDKSKWVGD